MENNFLNGLDLNGCFVCLQSQKSIEHFWNSFSKTNYDSWPMIDSLSRGGFCKTHALHAMETVGDTFISSLSYMVKLRKNNLKTVLSFTETKLPRRQRLFRNASGKRIPLEILTTVFGQEECPACKVYKLAEERCLGELGRDLKRQENQQKYSSSDGLCWKHFNMGLQFFEQDVAIFLMQDNLIRFENLEKRLSEVEQLTWLKEFNLQMGL